MKKIVVGRSRVIHWWRIIGAVALIIAALVIIWPAGENERHVSVRPSAPSATITVAPSDQPTPSRQFGKWRVLLTAEFSREFCPPGGSFTRVERADSSVGVTYLVQRLDGQWSKPIYHPPGDDEHLKLGAFLCLRHKAEKDTSITITVSRTPFS